MGPRRSQPAGYVCQLNSFPAYKWTSSGDDTSDVLGITCARLATPLPSVNLRDWYGWLKVLRSIP